MFILTEIPEAEAREALEKVSDSVLEARNAGTTITLRLSNGAGMLCKYVLCEKRDGVQRCRLEVVGKIIPRRGFRNRLGGK